jgi:hypothetical protein
MRYPYNSVFFAATLVAAAAGYALAAEAPSQVTAESVLGDDAMGENWTVSPMVGSDGYFRTFAFTTPYGDFEVTGTNRMRERIQELRALQTLEEISTTSAFGDALGRAAMAPLRFGANLVTDPIETTGNVFAGIGDMFRSVTNSGPRRDPLFNRLVGISAAERELAYQLQVDPYSDFSPLRNGLSDVANAAAAGGLTITGAIMAIPGGAGVVASASATGADFADSVYSMTSYEVAAAVAEKLQMIGVSEETTEKFVGNLWYSPNDQFAIVEALEQLSAENTEAFISVAAEADSFDLAKFHRYRAELLARENERLGTLSEFTVIGETALSYNADRSLVAAFPFDVVEWTDSVAENLSALSDAAAAESDAATRVFASTGDMSPVAITELGRRGWTIVRLD